MSGVWETPCGTSAGVYGTPVKVQRGAREVVVILFVPIAQGLAELPHTRRREIEWVFELLTLASAESLVSLLLTVQGDNTLGETDSRGPITVGQTRLLPVAPATPLGMHSLLHWGAKQTEELFDAGYRDASQQLGN